MPYLVDGHNLIGAMGKGALARPEDEGELADLLQSYCASSGKAVTVYFDRRAPGSSNPPARGKLRIYFVSETSSADHAILAHLKRLGGDARNWTLVTSDRPLQKLAAPTGVKILTSEAFLPFLRGVRLADPDGEAEVRQLSDRENQDLLRAFRARRPPPGPKAQ